MAEGVGQRTYRRLCPTCFEMVEVKLVVFEYEEGDVWELRCVDCGCIISTRVALIGGEPREWIAE